MKWQPLDWDIFMDKTRKLEKQWFKYKRKKFFSALLILSIFTILLSSLYYLFQSDKLNVNRLKTFFLSSSEEVKNNISDNVEVESSVVTKTMEDSNHTLSLIDLNSSVALPLVIEKIQEVREISLEPIIPIIDMDKEEAKRTHIKKKVHHKKSTQARVKAKKSNYLTQKELSKITHTKGFTRDTTKLKKIHLSSSSSNYIETMKRKFLKHKNPRDALLLAKVFYKRKLYKKAEKWSFSANKIDKSLEESWIIFAKSKAKLGKKDEAIKILFMYYKKNKSKKIKELIQNIKRGRV